MVREKQPLGFHGHSMIENRKHLRVVGLILPLERFSRILDHLTGLTAPVGRRGSPVDVVHRPRTAQVLVQPRGPRGRPSVATLSHSDALRRLPDEPHRATRRAYPNGLWTPSNEPIFLKTALADGGETVDRLIGVNLREEIAED